MPSTGPGHASTACRFWPVRRCGLTAVQPNRSRDWSRSSIPLPAVESPPGVRAYWRFEEEPSAPADDGLSTQIGVVGDSSGGGIRLDYWPGGKSGIGPYRFSNDVPPPHMFHKGFDGGRHSFDCGALNADAAGVAISAGNHGLRGHRQRLYGGGLRQDAL